MFVKTQNLACTMLQDIFFFSQRFVVFIVTESSDSDGLVERSSEFFLYSKRQFLEDSWQSECLYFDRKELMYITMGFLFIN